MSIVIKELADRIRKDLAEATEVKETQQLLLNCASSSGPRDGCTSSEAGNILVQCYRHSGIRLNKTLAPLSPADILLELDAWLSSQAIDAWLSSPAIGRVVSVNRSEGTVEVLTGRRADLSKVKEQSYCSLDITAEEYKNPDHSRGPVGDPLCSESVVTRDLGKDYITRPCVEPYGHYPRTPHRAAK